MQHKQITDALNWRYGVKAFNPDLKVKDEDLKLILESGRLAPSSIGTEPWKFLIIKNPELRTKIRAAAYDQTKVTDAPYLIVIARRTDNENISDEAVSRVAQAQGKTVEELQGLKDMLDGAIGRQNEAGTTNAWFVNQTYIALGMMIETAALLGIDTGPMEGFDSGAVNEILNLKSKNLAVVTMLAIGYRGDDVYATLPKSRRVYEEVVEVI